MKVYGEVLRGRRIESGVYQYKNNKFIKLRSKNSLRINIEPVSKASQSQVEDMETLIRLEKDLEYLYHLDAVRGEEPIVQFQKEDGELDERRVYYQGNPLVTCFKFQDVAYTCLAFLAYMNDSYIGQYSQERRVYIQEELVPFAKEMIDMYKGLRDKIYSQADIRMVKVLTGEYTPRNKKERSNLDKLKGVVNIAES